MVISQKLTPVSDPSQAEQQKMMTWMMPIMFGVIFMSFSSALMLYWLFFNIFNTAQMYKAMKQGEAEGNAPGSGSGGGGTLIQELAVEEKKSAGKSKSGRRKKKFEALNPVRQNMY